MYHPMVLKRQESVLIDLTGKGRIEDEKELRVGKLTRRDCAVRFKTLKEKTPGLQTVDWISQGRGRRN